MSTPVLQKNYPFFVKPAQSPSLARRLCHSPGFEGAAEGILQASVLHVHAPPLSRFAGVHLICICAAPPGLFLFSKNFLPSPFFT